MTDEGQDKDKDTEGQGNGGDADTPKTYTAEEVEAIVKKRLAREQAKHQEQIEQAKKDIEEAAGKKSGETADEYTERLAKLEAKLAETEQKSANNEFKANIAKYSAKYGIDVEFAETFVNQLNIQKDEDGNADFDGTFKKLAGNVQKKGIGGEPQRPQDKAKEFSQMTEQEKTEYFKKHGAKAYAELASKKK